MKNVLWVLCFLFSFPIFGQPVAPYKENGYSKKEVFDFAMAPGSLSKSFRTEMARIVKEGIKEKEGYIVFVTEESIQWILDSVRYEQVNLPIYQNSKNSGGQVIFFTDTNFIGSAGVFYFRKCRIPLFKTICINLLEARFPEIIIQNVPKVEQYDDKSYDPTPPSAPSVVAPGNVTNNYYYSGGQVPQPQPQPFTGYGLVSTGIHYICSYCHREPCVCNSYYQQVQQPVQYQVQQQQGGGGFWGPFLGTLAGSVIGNSFNNNACQLCGRQGCFGGCYIQPQPCFTGYGMQSCGQRFY